MLQLLYRNFFIRLAFMLLICIFICAPILCEVEKVIILFNLLFLVVFLLFFIAFFQEMFFLMSSRKAYFNLAVLISETRKLESLLSSLGGEGKGLYEKAESLLGENHKLLSDILLIATARNEAMHGDPKVQNLKELLVIIKDVEKKIMKKYFSESYYLFRIVSKIALYTTPLVLVFFINFYGITDIGKLIFVFTVYFIFNKFFYDVFSSKTFLVMNVFMIFISGWFLYDKGENILKFFNWIEHVF